jgi:hypothetical protein
MGVTRRAMGAGMTEVGTEYFTIGVFKDVEWAARGIAALRSKGFEPASLSCIARATPEAAALIGKALGLNPEPRAVAGLGPVLAVGPLVATLDGSDRGLERRGLAATLGRAGFQAHDGHIYEALTSRGGVLVAVRTEARAADALAVLHAYGGGNAAIGAWLGRL